MMHQISQQGARPNVDDPTNLPFEDASFETVILIAVGDQY